VTVDGSLSGGAFAIGSKSICFWSELRQAFIPITAPSTAVFRIGKAVDLIEADTSGPVRLWHRNLAGALVESDENPEPIIAWHDWVTNAEDIAEGTEVILGYFSEDHEISGAQGIWRIIGAECP
jgi:hypothetical protein